MCDYARMNDLRPDMHSRLRHARAKAGFRSARSAALKFGWVPSTYGAHENGQSGYNDETAQIYAKAFAVPSSWLKFGDDSQTSVVEPSRLHIVPPPSPTDDRIPVIGAAIGGEDGRFLFNGEVIEYVARPSELKSVNGAYSVYVQGVSMMPRLRPGELLHVHPSRPPRAEDEVVVQLHPSRDGDPPEGYVKEFRHWTPENLILWQHNPPIEIKIPRKKVLSVHVVVGWRK